MYQPNRRFAVLLLAAASSSCGARIYGNRATDARYAMHAAEKAGAADYPAAARLLEAARLQAMTAHRWADDGDDENAALLLDRAEADAELALRLTLAEEQRQQAREAWLELFESVAEPR